MKKLITIPALALAMLMTLTATGQPHLATSTLDATSTTTPTQDGKVFTHKEGGIQFELPEGWKAVPDGDNITVSSPDGGLQVVFWVPDEETMDETIKALDKELGKTVKNIKTDGKPTQDMHNGMPHYSENGTGEVDGNTIVWSVDVLAAKKPVIILTFAAPSLFEKHAANYEKLVNSIRKVR